MELVHARKWWPRPAYLSSRVASDARVPECLTRVGYRTHPSRRFPPTYLPSAGFARPQTGAGFFCHCHGHPRRHRRRHRRRRPPSPPPPSPPPPTLLPPSPPPPSPSPPSWLLRVRVSSLYPSPTHQYRMTRSPRLTHVYPLVAQRMVAANNVPGFSQTMCTPTHITIKCGRSGCGRKLRCGDQRKEETRRVT